MNDNPYAVLLEEVRFGPRVARNRFFQVPHCNGMGYRDVRAHAEMRAVKAQGGWAVICTEETEIHHSSEVTPYIEARLWDDADIPALAIMTERIHDHGALAGIELAYNGMNGPNLTSRTVPMGPAHLPVAGFADDPVQARAMTLSDIANLRRWHRQAVRRSLQAGFDLVYVYGGHALGVVHHFLSPRYNQRSDAYGGSVENRMRLLRELLIDTVEEVDGAAAVGCRITVDELIGDSGISRGDIEAVLGELGEIPDLWDFVMGSWEDDSVTSRFGPEGGQEEYVTGLKALTSKPVVGVRRFTSPDTMVRMVRQGVIDFIGAARPSIADPYLPAKIGEGRAEDIRECIGCNICVSGDFTMSPIRCTQNPSMGEEWRRGWHPELYRRRHADESVLVVGAGPAGLEAAMSLGKRGYSTVLVEQSRQLGGRVAKEARLPGLAAWIRVLDYRQSQLDRLDQVDHYLQSAMTAQGVMSSAAENGFDHVGVATGSSWRRDGVGRWHTAPLPLGDLPVLTPDDLMAGKRPRRASGGVGTSANGRVAWEKARVTASGTLADRVSRKLVNDESLLPTYAGSRLKWDLDRVPMWSFDSERPSDRQSSVSVNQLWNCITQYLYLPRLVNGSVLEDAIRDGVQSTAWADDGFGYAEGHDGERYIGLRTGQMLNAIAPSGLVVHPDAASAQLDSESRKRAELAGSTPDTAPLDDGGTATISDLGDTSATVHDPDGVPDGSTPTRYYGRITVGSDRWTRTAADVAEAIVDQLNRADDVQTQVTIEVQATSSTGFDDEVKRSVTENAATLKFDDSDFQSGTESND